MKNNKGLAITAIVLAVLVAIMGSYIVYDNVLKTDDVTQPNAKAYTYDGVKGLYTYISETVTTESGDEIFAFYSLYLYENGTFKYEMGTGAPYGQMGNYIIKDNTIVLNYLFSTNSGVGITVATGSKTISITNQDTLVDNDPLATVGNMNSVALKRASAAEEKEYLQFEDFSRILKEHPVTNDASNN